MRRGPCRQYPEWIGEIPCLGQRTGELQGFIAGSAESVRVFLPVIAPQRGSTNGAGDQQPEAQTIEERGSRDRYLFLVHSRISFIGLSSGALSESPTGIGRQFRGESREVAPSHYR